MLSYFGCGLEAPSSAGGEADILLYGPGYGLAHIGVNGVNGVIITNSKQSVP